MNPESRKPAVAGSFYSDNPLKLENEVKDFFKNTKARKEGTVAVISPHAGYVFSGQVAADAISQIDPTKNYENVFILAVSHHVTLNGASVNVVPAYDMPGFSVEVNTQLALELLENDRFEYSKHAHSKEHSVEVQLPFLYYHLQNKFKIVPIVIGTSNKAAIIDIANTLKPYFNDKNIFVISTDFSHYPDYSDATENDKRTADAILTKNPDKFISILQENEKKKIGALATSACGASAILTLMFLTQHETQYKYEIIDYKNSGDSVLGGKDRVVGYFAISVRKQATFKLTEAEKETLLNIARRTVNSYVQSKTVPEIDKSKITPSLSFNIGAFVTLTKNGDLRGCIGRFMPNKPLYKIVQEMAIAAATQDSRFAPVNVDELGNIDIEISVLTPLQKIQSIEEVQIGRDGIYIRQGYSSGTLLPQVAVDHNWDRYQFVEYCSKYKANIGAEGWKDADLFIYQAIVFEE